MDAPLPTLTFPRDPETMVTMEPPAQAFIEQLDILQLMTLFVGDFPAGGLFSFKIGGLRSSDFLEPCDPIWVAI